MQAINVFSPDYDPYNGYGRESLELVWHWSQMGIHVNALGSDPLVFRDRLHPEMIKLLEKPIKPVIGGVVLGYPTLIESYAASDMLLAGPVLAQTMFESTRLPGGWATWLNKARAVSVPSEWLVKVFKDSGVLPPVYVMPCGISETFQYVDRAARYTKSKPLSHTLPLPNGAGEGSWIPRKDGKPFTFICLGDRGNRKGWDVAVDAFVTAFGDDPNYKLIIKARKLALNFTNPNIEILEADMTEQQLQQMYAEADAYIFPTRGEGFGLPPREAARTGLPVIATRFSGTADHIVGWGYPLNYKLVRAWEGHPNLAGIGKWAQPETAHLVKLMKHVVSRERIHMWYETAQNRQDRIVASRVKSLYSWKQFATQMYELWDKVSGAVTVAEKRARRKGKRTPSPNLSPASRGEE